MSARLSAKRAVAAVALAVTLASGPAWSLEIMVANNPPYTIQNETAGPTGGGLFLDVVRDMEAKLGLHLPVRFMGWSDVQATAQSGRNIMFFPYSRTAEREPRFMWVQKIWDIDETFISGPGSQAVDSYDDGGKLRAIGVVTGSTGHAELTKRQFGNLKTYANAVALTEALHKREVAAIYTADIEVKYAWRVANYPGDLVIGKTQVARALYIAASKDSPEIKPDDWARAYDAVRSDGSVERVYEQYFGKR